MSTDKHQDSFEKLHKHPRGKNLQGKEYLQRLRQNHKALNEHFREIRSTHELIMEMYGLGRPRKGK